MLDGQPAGRLYFPLVLLNGIRSTSRVNNEPLHKDPFPRDLLIEDRLPQSQPMQMEWCHEQFQDIPCIDQQHDSVAMTHEVVLPPSDEQQQDSRGG